MRIVEYMTATDTDEVKRHYAENDSSESEIDEGDLIIFRLLGAKFEYSAIEFKKTNPFALLVEFASS
jgi:hypothetical protein